MYQTQSNYLGKTSPISNKEVMIPDYKRSMNPLDHTNEYYPNDWTEKTNLKKLA